MRSLGQDQNIIFEFHKAGNNNNNSNRVNGANRVNSSSSSHHHRTALGKSTPSKWDDAQKWLVGFSSREKLVKGGQSKTSKPRNSNADDLRLIASVPQKEQEYYSSEEGDHEEEENGENNDNVETKNVDGQELVWRINKPAVLNNNNNGVSTGSSTTVVRSICVRDMGTDMTPIASQEPSRTATPLRATTPAARSPISSGSSTPVRCQQHRSAEGHQGCGNSSGNGNNNNGSTRRYNAEELSGDCKGQSLDQGGNNKLNPLETRAVAWDEAERAKYMARYKREEMKIQAWENHEKRKAEMEMRKMEVKAERIKARAEEKLANKLAATRRIAEEKRANAEAELNEKAVRTSERADYIRRTGHMPSSFSFKLPSLCW
ncbi:hypothetical protein L484_006742 [Morus notabilis]|uniref:Remorin C-terminal domain-containing protein n=1 Tax=Morus notabilis TaxID=981085 RepID=W9S9J6_9ROSA|nr:remorin 4.1 [Morus notabilis]EXB94977.1 hypothetical protein L484_006742 [Morus notabilis]